jgi:hypothetical protein
MSFGLNAATFGTICYGGLLGATVDGAPPPGGGGVKAAQVFIGGIEYTSKLNLTSLKIKDRLGARNTAEFRLIDTSRQIRFRVGEQVEITYDGAKIFAGNVDGVSEQIPFSSQVLFVDVRCVDFNALADRHIVANKFQDPNQTLYSVWQAINIIYSGNPGERLVDEGVGGPPPPVQVGPKLGTLVFNYVTVKEAFDDLAELTGFYWNIDYDKVLNFVDRQTFQAPYRLDEQFFQGFEGVRVSRKRDTYRNVQLIRAGKDQTDPGIMINKFKGDGEHSSFDLDLEVCVPKVNGLNVPPKVEVQLGAGAFVEKTVGVRQKDTGKDWYYEVEDTAITQDSGGTRLTTSDTLRVTYTGYFPIISEGRSDQQIQERRAIEGGTGVDVDVETDQKIDDADLAEEKVVALLRKYARIPNMVDFYTFTHGFKAGQLLSVRLPEHSIEGEFLIDEVTLKFKALRDSGEEIYQYNVSTVEGEFLGGWVDFFRRQSTKGRPFVIRENEKLLLLRQAIDTIGLADFVSFVQPLGSFKLDLSSNLICGGPWAGGARQTSVTDLTPAYYYGARCGTPQHVGVS